MIKYTEEQILELIKQEYDGCSVLILAPVVNSRKGHYKELFEQIRRKGYLNVRVDGAICEIVHGMKLDRYKNHTIEVVIDKLAIVEKNEKRIKDSVRTALKQGNGTLCIVKKDETQIRHFSKLLMCPTSGISYPEPAPHNFSFNSPHGACPKCKGLGVVNEIDMDKIIPNRNLSIYEGGIIPLGKYKKSLIFWQIESIGEKYGFTIKTPISKIPEEALDVILNGCEERIGIKSHSLGLSDTTYRYDGVIRYIEMQQEGDASASAQKWAEQFSKTIVCPECEGTRLNNISRHFRIGDKNISELFLYEKNNEKVKRLVMFTDGIEIISFDFSSNKPHIAFFNPIFSHLLESDSFGFNKNTSDFLTGFLNSSRVNQRTDDDKTLVIASLCDIDSDL